MVGSVWHTEDVVLRLFSRMKKDDSTLVFFNLTERGILDHPAWRTYLGHFWNRAAVKGAPVAAFVNRIFRDMTSVAVAQYVAWEVVRQLGPFADFRLRIPDESNSYTEERCFRAVYEVAGLAPLAVVMAQDVDADAILSAAAFLEGLLLDVGATNVTLQLLDPKRLLAETSVCSASTTSSTEDGDSGSFFRSYIRSLKAFRQRELDALESPDTNSGPVDVLSYQAVLEGDRLTVPTSLLTRPWFSREFPPSFNYAGVGFVVLEALIRAGVKLEIQHMPTVGLPVGKPASTTTMGCSETAGTAGQALEAVLQVLSLKGSQRSSLRLPGELETLSEKQLLFLAFCMRDCAGNETSSRKCNGVLRRTWYFGNTFECILGRLHAPKGTGWLCVGPRNWPTFHVY
ncbi:hypothetical protein MRX96_040631 [Rhipicephalus microplus]